MWKRSGRREMGTRVRSDADHKMKNWNGSFPGGIFSTLESWAVGSSHLCTVVQT